MCAQSLCVPGSQGERRQGWEALMGKWASVFQPSTGERLKRPGEMMSWTLSFPPLMCFSSLLQQRRSPGAGAEPGFGQTHHAHQRNIRQWWLHWAEIKLPSIRRWKGLLWNVGFPGLGVVLSCFTHLVCFNLMLFEFRVRQLRNCGKLPFCFAK